MKGEVYRIVEVASDEAVFDPLRNADEPKRNRRGGADVSAKRQGSAKPSGRV
jgi:hypothetical protein